MLKLWSKLLVSRMIMFHFGFGLRNWRVRFRISVAAMIRYRRGTKSLLRSFQLCT
uniref:Uncharacterized protein n=1 Tax=Arundo donax TaxID=35708 RepID=A0A0A9CJB8_ARUDO